VQAKDPKANYPVATSPEGGKLTQEGQNPTQDSRSDTSKKDEESFDLGPTHSGAMGGGASGPRDVADAPGGNDAADGEINAGKAGVTGQTGGSGTGTQGSSNVAAQLDKNMGQTKAPSDKGQEEIENYGSRREDASDQLSSDRKSGSTT
jgi:hypothetical protein